MAPASNGFPGSDLYYLAVATSELIFLHGQSVPRCTHRVDKFFTGYQTLQFMSAGAVELSIGSEKRRLEGRWFWSAYPGPRIAFHVAPPLTSWTHRYIAFQGPLVARWVAEGLFPVPPQPAPETAEKAARDASPESVKRAARNTSPQSIDQSTRGASSESVKKTARDPSPGATNKTAAATSPGAGDFGRRFDEMLAAAHRADRWGPRRAVHLLEGILLELAEARSSTPAHGKWLEIATAKLSASLDGQLPDYAALAAELGLGETTFRRKFRQATGASPHAYVLQCRLAEARRLLGETDLPVKTVAEKLGYRDVYFFSRQFRQLAGVAPTVYRQSRQ